MSRAEGQAVLDDLAEEYATTPGATRRQMFGSLALCRDDKIVGFVGMEGEMVVKLPAGRVDELVDDGVGERVRIGRNPAREWVGVSLGTADRWPDLLAESFAHLASAGG